MKKPFIAFLFLLMFLLIHPGTSYASDSDDKSLGDLIKQTKKMYEAGKQKKEIADWLTREIDKHIISSNSSEALNAPIWASVQVYWVRNDPSNKGEYNEIANSSWGRGYGNCEENSAIAYYVLKKAGVKENVRVLRTAKHSFCVWNLPPTAQTNDPSTWGEALIVDPWYGDVLPGQDAATNKYFQNGDPENKINDATRDIDLNADDWRVI